MISLCFLVTLKVYQGVEKNLSSNEYTQNEECTKLENKSWDTKLSLF